MLEQVLRTQAIPGLMETEGREKLAEYLCTLQPRGGSQLSSELRDARRTCTMQFGQDEAGLYPPHVSVTGFFRATKAQAAQLGLLLVDLVAEGSRTTRFHIEGRKIILVSNGHVLIDVHAPEVAELARAFACKAASHGVHVRPKDVRHLSLASGRSADVQILTQEVFSGVPFGHYDMDLVLARLVHRASPAGLTADAVAHQFSEELRLPLLAPASPSAICTAAIDTELGSISTPVRKRGQAACPYAELRCSTAQAHPADAVHEDVTPAKTAKLDMELTRYKRAGRARCDDSVSACACVG